MYIHTVPLNCNFIFTCVITRGTTAILQCIPVACLRGPRLVVSCNVHVSWKLTRGSVRLVEAHAWKCTSRGSSRVEVYVSWKLTRGSVRLVEAHAWKCTSRGSSRMEVYVSWKLRRGTKHACTHMHVKTYLPSLSHYITPIFCWFTSTMSCIDSSVAHI